MIFSRVSAIAGAVFGGLAVFLIMQAVNALWIIPGAKDAGREIERAAILKQAMENIEERSKTNAEIRNLDDAGLCRELGGVLEDGICR
jgi:hypothetical protein